MAFSFKQRQHGGDQEEVRLSRRTPHIICEEAIYINHAYTRKMDVRHFPRKNPNVSKSTGGEKVLTGTHSEHHAYHMHFSSLYPKKDQKSVNLDDILFGAFFFHYIVLGCNL